MRVVVDTDVFVSAALKEASWPGRVVRWVDPTGGLPKTEVAEAPVMDVLQRPYFAAKIAGALSGSGAADLLQGRAGADCRAHLRLP